MKRWLYLLLAVALAIAIAVVLMFALSKSEQKFSVETCSVRGIAEDTYDVTVSIRDVTDAGSPIVLSEPSLTVRKGEEGSVTVGTDSDGYHCTVLVDDSPGELFTTTTVKIRRSGQVIWMHQRMDHVKNPPQLSRKERR